MGAVAIRREGGGGWDSMRPTLWHGGAEFLLLEHARAGKVPLMLMDEGVLLPQGCRGCADQLAEV